MGKAARLKVELEDVSSLLEILTVLKDVSSNRFFVFHGKKIHYHEFFELFIKFFELLKSAQSQCPLLANTHPGVDILVLTSELGFMSQLNSRVSSLAFEEYSKSPVSRLICIGHKGAEKCKSLGMKIEKTFQLPVEGERIQSDIEIRDFLVERIVSGKTGKVVVAYVWAKSLGVLKPELITLLPISGVVESLKNSNEFDFKKLDQVEKKFIFETNLEAILITLSNLWVYCRVHEMLNNLRIVEAAAQAQQLESAIESMSSEKKKVILDYRKASREELNAAMRGVITSTNMTKQKARRAALKT